MVLSRTATTYLYGWFFFLTSQFLFGEEMGKVIVATRLSAPISVDGKLSEVSWQNTPFVSDFIQFDPEEGAQPTEKTSIKILYDDNALYVGVYCYDSEPSAIERQITRRDRNSQADRLSVIIDSYHDHNTAFLFSGSVSGVVADGILSHDGLVYDVQWDAVWDFEANSNDDGWSGEFKIPFNALRFNQEDTGYVWGINFRRYIARKKETIEWFMVPRSETPPGTISMVSMMGHLTGIRGIKPPIHIEVLPYTVAKVSDLYIPQLSSQRREIEGTLGVDIKYGVSNNSTLDIAINPDFGQVEVDQAVLNLTVFETFYPEKRPFFLEGAQLFSFGTLFDNRSLNLFYSRRIGKQPQQPFGSPAAGYFFVDQPRTTTILGAAKFTGKTENGFSFGMLSAVTQQEEGVEQNIAGNTLPGVIFEPEASYNVLRLKNDISDQFSVGMMATGVFKDTRLPTASGGVDWRLRVGDGAYGIDGYLAGSMQTPQPDNRLTGAAGRIGLGKLEADHWLGFTFYDFSTKNFLINDLGYYSQPREHGGYTQITYKEDAADAPARRFANTLQLNYRWNWEGKNTVAELEFEPSVEFRNFWVVTMNYTQKFPAYDDESRGINGLYRRPSGNSIIATVQTDSRKPVSLLLHGGIETSAKGMNSIISVNRLTLRPTAWMELIPGFTFSETRDDEAWVIPQYTDDGKNLFGIRDVDYRDYSLRGTFTFSPRLSFQVFTQVLLVKIHYEEFKVLESPTRLAPYDVENSSTFYEPDFNQQVFNANFVLRWEYMPGSAAYLVWTQAREGYRGMYSTSFGEDFGATFRLPMDNILLLKVSYLWGL